MLEPPNSRRLFATAAAALVLLAVPGWLGAQAPKVGEPFPDIALRTLDGDERRVSDFRGTKLVLHVFASW